MLHYQLLLKYNIYAVSQMTEKYSTSQFTQAINELTACFYHLSSVLFALNISAQLGPHSCCLLGLLVLD